MVYLKNILIQNSAFLFTILDDKKKIKLLISFFLNFKLVLYMFRIFYTAVKMMCMINNKTKFT